MIKKSIPSENIIKILTEEIKNFGLEFAKGKPIGNVSKLAFDNFITAIPKTQDNTKASMNFGAFDMQRKDQPFVKEVIDILGAKSCTNTMYYTQNSCIDWHTNSDNVGTRVYIIFTNKPGIFRYKDPFTGTIVDDMDYIGWTQREFKVDKNNLLWHCVHSPSPRFAYGFNR